MALIDYLHQADIGVILDWVPAHFPTDPHGLARFDGEPLYEHADPRHGFHPDWDSCDLRLRPRRRCATSCLSSALFWLERYHVDGLRVDAVASMLYLDYSRTPGEWIPNARGGNENLEAVEFLQRLNAAMRRARRRHDRRGVDGVAARHRPGARARPRLLVQVGHGLDARHARVLRPRSDLPQVPPRRAHVPRALRLQRALRAAAVARRGRVRQGLAARARCRATTGSSARTCACSTRSWAPRPARSCCSWAASSRQWREWDHERSLDWHLLDEPRHRQIQLLVGRAQPPLSHRARAPRARLRARPASGGSMPTTPSARSCVRAARRRRRPA